MEKYCINCGQKLDSSAKFCSKCGTPCESYAEPTACEEAQDYTQMDYKLKPGMSPEDMAEKWVNVSWKKNENVDNLTSTLVKGMDRAIYPRYYANCFKTLLNEIQIDEKGLLYFTGVYEHAGNHLLDAGAYAYILTNKRIIMAGAFSNMGSAVIPFNAFKQFLKNFTCAKKTLYLHELQDVTMEMVRGFDALLFHAGSKSFRVVFAGKNITHRLCKEIHDVLNQLKEQQDTENAEPETLL